MRYGPFSLRATSGGAASCRAMADGEREEGGRMSHAKAAKAAKCADGKRKVGIYKNVSNAAART